MGEIRKQQKYLAGKLKRVNWRFFTRVTRISVCWDVAPCNVIKVKESRNRPGVAQRVPGALGSQISMTFGI